jgi:hypothetical protein
MRFSALGFGLLAGVFLTPVSAAELVQYECPSFMKEHKLIKWGLYFGSGSTSQLIAPEGIDEKTGLTTWNFKPTKVANGFARIRCNYIETADVQEYTIPPEMRRCTNKISSALFACDKGEPPHEKGDATRAKGEVGK